MPILPFETLPLLAEFVPCLSQPTYRRFLVLMAAAILEYGNDSRQTGPFVP